MLGFELKQREAKLAREQAARLDAARRKLAEEQSREERCAHAQGPQHLRRAPLTRARRVRKQQEDLAEALRRRRLEAAEAEQAVRPRRLRARSFQRPLTRLPDHVPPRAASRRAPGRGRGQQRRPLERRAGGHPAR
jgi:hypothetical protein